MTRRLRAGPIHVQFALLWDDDDELVQATTADGQPLGYERGGLTVSSLRDFLTTLPDLLEQTAHDIETASSSQPKPPRRVRRAAARNGR